MKTKIIATIGPASIEYPTLKNMVTSGMDIARINTKYGSTKYYLKITDSLTKIGKCKILYDIKSLKKIPWLKTQKFDYLAVSFAKSGLQIKKIRELFHPMKINIISKIESKQGIDNFNEILKESDGIMVARGDLGKNIPFEKVPIAQKLIIKKCNKRKKWVVTATEMLLSMIHSKIPTRAEVSDVANAVLDGSNAVMLSEETAIGKYPSLSIRIMKKIIKETEKKSNLLNVKS